LWMPHHSIFINHSLSLWLVYVCVPRLRVLLTPLSLWLTLSVVSKSLTQLLALLSLWSTRSAACLWSTILLVCLCLCLRLHILLLAIVSSVLCLLCLNFWLERLLALLSLCSTWSVVCLWSTMLLLSLSLIEHDNSYCLLLSLIVHTACSCLQLHILFAICFSGQPHCLLISWLVRPDCVCLHESPYMWTLSEQCWRIWVDVPALLQARYLHLSHT
jgi:hypothetical protein